MKIANTYTLITDSGNTSDIITVVMSAYDAETDPQISVLAQKLRGVTPLDTCRKVWQFLIDNISYEADRDTQEVKTPARLIVDGEGDCKSYSILLACVLRELDIPHFFRFVSYDRRKEATHVYIVAVINGVNIPVDAVAYMQAGVAFGNELKYTFRCDMANGKTKIAYLAGVGKTNPRRSIGAIVDFDINAFFNGDGFKIWLDGETEGSLTMAKGYLLSEWELNWTVVKYATESQKVFEALSKLVCISDMLRLYNEFRSNNEMLYRIGLAFNAMISDGFYNFSTGDVDTLPWFSDQNRNTVLEYVQRDYTLTGNDAFIEAWKANIIDNNRIYTDANGAPMSISGVEDLRNKVTQTGGFYIFTHIPESNSSKYGLKIYAKRKVQMAQRSLDHQYIGSQVSPAEIDNLHYKGCAETFGALPEDVISGNANINGIGEPIAAIVSIIVAVTGIITAIATLIRAKNGALTKEELNSAVISEADFAMFGSSSGGGTGGSGSGTNYQQAGFGGSSWLLPVLGIGALGLIFMKGKKSKKKSKGK